MDIRIAKINEVTQVRQWISETAIWLREKDIPQWQRFLEYNATEVCLEDYCNKKLFVLVDDKNSLVGSLYLGEAQDIDKLLWEKDKEAYYIHRLIVARDFKNNKYGEYIINWAKEVTKREGKELRLNCAEGNEKLHNYYKMQGLEYCGCKLGYHLFKTTSFSG